MLYCGWLFLLQWVWIFESDAMLDVLSFLRIGEYEHETNRKRKPENRSLQQYIMLAGLRVLGRGARAVSLKWDPNGIPGLPEGSV